jgi:hypothetical protein
LPLAKALFLWLPLAKALLVSLWLTLANSRPEASHYSLLTRTIDSSPPLPPPCFLLAFYRINKKIFTLSFVHFDIFQLWALC